MGNRKLSGRLGARYRDRTLGTKLIALFDIQKQALGSDIYLNFHTCCKGRVKLPHDLIEMDVFGQLLLSP